MNATFLKIGIIALAIIAAAGAKYILHLPDNNAVEKIAMEVINDEMEDDSEDEDSDGFIEVDLNE